MTERLAGGTKFGVLGSLTALQVMLVFGVNCTVDPGPIVPLALCDIGCSLYARSKLRYGQLTVARARDLLNYSDTNPDMELKMEGHLLALWFNMVSGRLAVKKAVNVSSVSGWPTVMDDIGGNPLTFAYKVALEIEEKAQPARAPFAINSVAKNLAEATNERTIIVP